MARARAYYVVGAPIAAFLSVAPIADLIIWMWFLIAAEIAVCLMLAQEWQTKPNPVPVRADEDRPAQTDWRLVPRLRSHRPLPIVEMQLAWRRAAQARRLRRAS